MLLDLDGVVEMPRGHKVISAPPTTSAKMRSFQVLLMMAVFAAHVVIGASVSIMDFTPDTLLENLSSEELENLFESSMELLESELVQMYENHLRNYQESADKLGALTRSRRQERDLPSLRQDFWHSGTGDMQFDNREVLQINSIDVKGFVGEDEVEKVFILNLWSLPAIYLGTGGAAMIVKDGKLAPLYVRNAYTKSLTGCRCPHSDGLSLDCACCSPGYCLCKETSGYSGQVCVPCGQENYDEICTNSKPYQLRAEVVTSFEYYLDEYDPVEGLQRVIITSRGNKVYFYRIDDDGLQPMSFQNGMTTITLANPITHLGFGEKYMNLHGSIRRDRFLVTFGSGGHDHQFHGLGVASKKLKSGLSQMWHATGTDMKVWNSGLKIMVGVQKGDSILIHEIKANYLHEYKVMPMQTISSGGGRVVSWKNFAMNFENYLIVVSPDVAKIYHQNGDYYELLQDLKAGGNIAPFQNILHFTMPSRRDKSVLLTGRGRNLIAYVWNGSNQQMQPAYSTTIETNIDVWETAVAHSDSTGFGPTVVIAEGTIGLVSLEINATLQELPDPLSLQVQSLQERIQELEEEYERQAQVMKTLQERLDDTVEYKTTLVGPITIRNGISVGDILTTAQLKTNKVYLDLESQEELGGEKLDYGQHTNEHNTYEEGLKKLDEKLEFIRDRLEEAVLVGDTGKTIEGKKILQNGSLLVDRLNGTEVDFRTSTDENGRYIPLDTMLEDIVRYGTTEEVTGTKIFSKPLLVDDLIPEYIDGIPVEDFITTTDDVTIAGATYSDIVAETIIVSDDTVMGGVKVSSIPSVDDDITLGNCSFPEGLTVDEVAVNSNIVSGIDFKRLYLNTLKTTGGTINGSLAFTGGLDIKKTEAENIMGISTKRFMAETVFTDQSTTLNGTLNLPGFEVQDDLTVNGYVNGKIFPDDFPILGEGAVHLETLTFDYLEIDTLEMAVGSKVDDLSVDKIVTLSTEQYIQGEKYFAGGITVLGDLDVTSKIVDAVNLDQLNASIFKPRFDEDKEFEVIFAGDLIVPSISYNGTLSGINLKALTDEVLYDDESPMIVKSEKTFKSGLNITNVSFKSTFNGEHIFNLVTLDKDQIITGKKTFENGISINTINVTGLVDNTDLTQLEENAVYRDKPGQVVNGEKLFTGTIDAKELEIRGKVNTIDFANVVTVDGAQTFTAPQVINNGEFSSVIADSVKMNDPVIVNGINLSEINEKRISLKSPLKFNGTLTITGPVKINSSLFVDSINDHKLSDMFDNIVKTNEPFEMDSKVIFSNLTVYGAITTEHSRGANGISIKDINAKAMHLNSDGYLFGNTTWDEIVLEGGVIGNGLFNGFDLEELSREAVFSDKQNQVITGKKTFLNGFQVRGNIETGTINGIDLRNRLLSRTTEQIIKAPFTFSSVVAEKNVNIYGDFNGIDISHLRSNVLKEHEITLRGNLTLHNTVDVHHLKLKGFLNGLDLESYLEDAVRLDETDVVITGKKTFVQPPEIKNINVETLNGVNFNDFLDHIVMIDSSANISRTVTVDGLVTVPEVLADEVVIKGSVDGVDISAFEDVVYLDEDRILNASLVITGDVHVEGDIEITQLNGHNIETDFLTVDSEQVIPHNVTFRDIRTNDVGVGGLVNSWNLPREVDNTLLTTGGQTITGLKTFSGPVKVLGSVDVKGRVGTDFKVDLARQAVKLDGDAEIEGLLIFNETLHVKNLSGSTDMINGINYTDLCDKAWFINKPATITGKMSFTSDAQFMDGLFYNSSDDKPTIGDLHTEILSLTEMVSRKTFELNKQYSELCQSVVSLNKQLENAIYEGDYFDLVYREKVPGQRHSSLAFQVSNITYVVMSWENPKCDSTMYRFSPKASRLEEISTIRETGYGHQWLFLDAGDTEYLAMAASPSSNNCSRNSCTIWKLNEDHSVTVHQELVPGERISLKYFGRGGMKLFVHASDHTTTYKFNPTSQLFEEYLISDTEIVDIALSLHMKNKTSIMFRAHKGHGKVIIGGKAGARSELAKDIADAVLFEQNEKVFVAISALIYEREKPAYVIKLYLVDITTRRLQWLDLQDVSSPANLTLFFAGNEVSGTTFLIVTQSNRYPLVYTLLGEKLRIFTELDIPRVEWTQYISIPGRRYPAFLEHFLLFGQRDQTFLLTQLVMKGASVSKGESEGIDCNIQFLTGNSFP